jgi:hypothetical protein
MFFLLSCSLLQCLFSSARAVTSLKLDLRRARCVALLRSSCTNDSSKCSRALIKLSVVVHMLSPNIIHRQLRLLRRCQRHSAGPSLRPAYQLLSSARCNFLGSANRSIHLLEAKIVPGLYLCTPPPVCPGHIHRPSSIYKPQAAYSSASVRLKQTLARRTILNVPGARLSRRRPCFQTLSGGLRAADKDRSHESQEGNEKGGAHSDSQAESNPARQNEGGETEVNSRRGSRAAKRKARNRRIAEAQDTSAANNGTDNEASDGEQGLSEEKGEPLGRESGPPAKRRFTPGAGFNSDIRINSDIRKIGRKERKPKKGLLEVSQLLQDQKNARRRGGRREQFTRETEPPTAQESISEGSPREYGGSAKRALDAWERPLPKRTLERTQKDRALRPAVENILKYWKDDKNKELGMTDELVQLLVELLDKYNAYLQRDVAPWGQAIGNFIEAVSANRDEISTHLDEFVEEVRAFVRGCMECRWRLMSARGLESAVNSGVGFQCEQTF